MSSRRAKTAPRTSRPLSIALELGGWAADRTFAGINGGTSVTTGFGYDTVMSVAPAVIDAVNSGDIKRFILLAGCDGMRKERSYYTDFARWRRPTPLS